MSTGPDRSGRLPGTEAATAPTDDSALIKSLALGDRQALKILYDRHAGFVYRVAYRFLGDGEDARDITQAVFVTLMESAHSYRPRARLTTWIYRIVVNRCLNHRAKAHRRLRTDLPAGNLDAIPAAEDNRPDRIAGRTEQRAHLLAALGSLPERQRMALILRCLEGQGYQEMAEALGCSKKAVESLLVRARRGLARHFPE